MPKPDYRKEIIFSIILFGSFFISYIKLGPLSISGYEIADNAKSIFDFGNLLDAKVSDEAKIFIYKAYSLYLIPVLSGLTIILALLDVNPKFTAALSGLYVVVAFTYCLFTFDKFLNLAGIGTYIGTISAILLLIFSLASPVQKQNSNVIQGEKPISDEPKNTIQNEQINTKGKMSLQEWKIQNPTKSLNDYYKEFGS
ncbi:hypothetical protein [Ferruginibacter sp.]